MKHTPKPWYYEKGLENYNIRCMYKVPIGYNITEANAEFIVRTCNSHENLLDLLRAARKRLDYAKRYGFIDTKLEEDINKAIAKAEDE